MNEVEIKDDVYYVLNKYIDKAFSKEINIRFVYSGKNNKYTIDVYKEEDRLISFSNEYMVLFAEILVEDKETRFIPYRRLCSVRASWIDDIISVLLVDNVEIMINGVYIEKIYFLKMLQEIIMLHNNGKKSDKKRKKSYVDYSNLSMPNIDLGISFEYDRKKYEDEQAMKKYKKKRFADKSTIRCDYTGETIHIKHNAAKNKYGSAFYTKYAAEVEHKESLKHAHEEYKKSILGNLVTDEQLNKRLNSDDNFAMINKKSNCGKKDYSYDEYINKNPNLSKDTKNRVKEMGAEAQKNIRKGLRRDAAKNIAKGVGEGAFIGAIYGGVSAGVYSTKEQIIEQKEAVKKGEKTKRQAVVDGVKVVAKDVGKESGRGAIEGFIREGLEIVIKAAGKTIVYYVKTKVK